MLPSNRKAYHNRCLPCGIHKNVVLIKQNRSHVNHIFFCIAYCRSDSVKYSQKLFFIDRAHQQLLHRDSGCHIIFDIFFLILLCINNRRKILYAVIGKHSKRQCVYLLIRSNRIHQISAISLIFKIKFTHFCHSRFFHNLEQVVCLTFTGSMLQTFMSYSNS